MHFHRTHGNAERRGDIAVVLTRHHQLHHLALARRQGAQQGLSLHLTLQLAACVRLARKRFIDGGQQLVVVKWFFQEIAGLRLECLTCQRHVAVPRDDNDGPHAVELQQAALQTQAIHARHADIDQQATGPLGPPAVQEILATGKQGRAIAAYTQQQTQRIAHGGIVIHDKHRQITCHHTLPSRLPWRAPGAG